MFFVPVFSLPTCSRYFYRLHFNKIEIGKNESP